MRHLRHISRAMLLAVVVTSLLHLAWPEGEPSYWWVGALVGFTAGLATVEDRGSR